MERPEATYTDRRDYPHTNLDTSPLDGALANLDTALDKAHTLLAALEGRLQVVLRPEQDEPAALLSATMGPRSSAVDRIWGMESSASRLTTRIEALMGRLDT